MIRHLTLTGVNAGQTLCGSNRNGNECHAVYSPLHKGAFRAECCPVCLKVYADSYEPEELPNAPEWVQAIFRGDGDNQGDLFGGAKAPPVA